VAPYGPYTRTASHGGLRKRVVCHAGQGLASLSLYLFLVSCGGESGSHYDLEKRFYEAEQSWDKVRLQQESGVATSAIELRVQLESVLEEFAAARPSLGPADSSLFAYAAGTTHHLDELLSAEGQWDEVARHQERVATDTLFPLAVRHRALFGWGQALEQKDQVREACELYRQLVMSFFPPWSEGGVNTDVLSLPTRRTLLAESALPESLSAYRAFAERYYDSLATGYPHTQMAFQALGELARIQGTQGRWDEALETLGRATDTAGGVFPAYRIDQGEILAAQKHDTAAALLAFSEVARDMPESPFRVDADLKTAAILFRRGRYTQVQTLLQETKRKASDAQQVALAVGPLLARAFAAEGNRDRARAEFSFIVTTFPRSLQAVEAAASIAMLYEEQNDTATASAWRVRADSLAYHLANDAQSSPQIVAAAMNARASLAVESEHWEDAASHLAAIAQTFGPDVPMGASALVRLGWVQLRELNDTLAAGQAWRAFLVAHPEHPDGATLKAEMNKWPERYRENHPS